MLDLKERTERFFNYSDEKLLELTGFFGIHPRENLTSFSKCRINRFVEKNIIEVFFESNLIRECRRTIYVEDNYILNEVVKARHPQSGLAYPFLKNQVMYAQLAEIDCLKIRAHWNPYDKELQWIGYYVYENMDF